jgi:hypothetical protein
MLFFPLCVVLTNFFFLNLFISVILENFYEMEYGGSNVGVTIHQSDIQHFKDAWAQLAGICITLSFLLIHSFRVAIIIDAETQLLNVRRLPRLLRSIPPPLGLGHLADSEIPFIKQVLMTLDLPVHAGMC